jgi:hypothetical protein
MHANNDQTVAGDLPEVLRRPVICLQRPTAGELPQRSGERAFQRPA